MTYGVKRGLLLLSLVAPLFLSACVSQSQFDTALADNQKLRGDNQQMRAQTQQLQQQVSAD